MLTLPFSDVLSVIKNKYTVIEREDNMLKCIMLWAEANGPIQEQESEALLNTINWSLISNDYLLAIVATKFSI